MVNLVISGGGCPAIQNQRPRPKCALQQEVSPAPLLQVSIQTLSHSIKASVCGALRKHGLVLLECRLFWPFEELLSLGRPRLACKHLWGRDLHNCTRISVCPTQTYLRLDTDPAVRQKDKGLALCRFLPTGCVRDRVFFHVFCHELPEGVLQNPCRGCTHICLQ